jgi:hypothetical protein
MPAKVSITRSFPSLPDLKLVSKEDMREIGLLARERIITRTLRGQSVDGGAFAPYSAGYADLKRSALGTSQVNLRPRDDAVDRACGGCGLDWPADAKVLELGCAETTGLSG